MNGPHQTDEAEPRLAVAHRADEIALRLRHATERLAAAAASEPGQERQGNVAALRSNLDEALEHAHRLVGLMTEHYPAEGAEYGKLVGAMGLRSVSPAPEATFAHLAQTVLYQLAHASRHADSMTDNPDIFDFDAEHCQHHLDGALEHVGKFEQNLMDGHYPAEAGWLAGLQPAAVSAARVTDRAGGARGRAHDLRPGRAVPAADLGAHGRVRPHGGRLRPGVGGLLAAG